MDPLEQNATALKILLALNNPPNALTQALDGHFLETLPDSNRLLDYISKKGYDLVVMGNEPEKIRDIKEADPRLEILLVGNHGLDVESMLNIGASACFLEPIDIREVLEFIEQISEMIQLRRETFTIEKDLKDHYTFAGVVGKNPKMLEINSFLRRIAPFYRSVLICGETGTGKEIISEALHSLSTKGKLPLVACNCPSIANNLIESTLFGHQKGAFTGAVDKNFGLFHKAGEGTLILDEVGELPLSFQPQLLRVCEKGDFHPLGSSQPQRARCRVIALTNRNLEDEVKRGVFREDLYYRLARLIIKIPPLRERKDDIPLLARHFLFRFSERTGKTVQGVSRPAMAALLEYDWPGNVRELKNVIEASAMNTQKNFIHLEDLSPSFFSNNTPDSHCPLSLEEVEKTHIRRTLEQNNHNHTQTATHLNISRRSLFRRLKKYQLA